MQPSQIPENYVILGDGHGKYQNVNKQEVHKPHRSPEKIVQSNKHI